jgi:hypothetical protein
LQIADAVLHATVFAPNTQSYQKGKTIFETSQTMKNRTISGAALS